MEAKFELKIDCSFLEAYTTDLWFLKAISERTAHKQKLMDLVQKNTSE